MYIVSTVPSITTCIIVLINSTAARNLKITSATKINT